MRLIDPSKTKVTHIKTGERTWVRYRDHHDGSRDAKVQVAALRLGMTAGAPINPEQLKAIGAIEEAQKAAFIAKHSGNDDWLASANEQVLRAKQRVMETQ